MIRALALAACLVVSACGTTPSPPPPDPAALIATYRAAVEQAAAASRANAKTPEERALVEAELAFAADARARGLETAFAAAAHPNSRLFVPGGGPIAIGPEAAGALYRGSTVDLRWAPVEWAVSGDLGVTWGVYALLIPGDPAPTAVRGRFVTAWKKDETGAWKWWLDMGNTGPGLPETR